MHSIVLDSGKKREVENSFTLAHGMILLSAILAIAVGLFVTKEILEKMGRKKRRQQERFEMKQGNSNESF